MTAARSDFKNALICVLICMGALLAAWPFAEMPFDDDFSWACTVDQLHKTGHLVYNGWSSPTVIFQAYWALLWVKLFGFSFTVLRASSLPMAAGSIVMCYALARRAGLSTSLSVFLTLMLGFSPVFMPLASTFMTDVPGLFFMLLSMYALLRGAETAAIAPAIGWLIFGAMTGLIGGSSRQVVWIVPLIVLPYIAWLRRTDHRFVLCACGSLLLVFAGAVLTQHWFALQLYSVPDPPVKVYILGAIHHPIHLIKGCLWVVLTIALLLTPALVVILYYQWSLLRALTALAFFCVLQFILWRLHHPLAPWMGNIITPTGVLGSIELAGNRPAEVPKLLLDLLSSSVMALVALLLSSAAIWIAQLTPEAIALQWRDLARPADNRAAPPAILLTSLALLGLELTRVEFDVAYDRHLLPLIPFLGIFLLMVFQGRGYAKMPMPGWILLAVFGVYAVGFTQEVNALARARVRAIALLHAGGITDPAKVDAGFEHSYWTQVTRVGHINDPRVLNPPGAYDKHQGPTPVMDVDYRLESEITKVTQSTPFGSVGYFSLLPPFHRRVYIDRFKDPWWHDKTKTNALPPAQQMLPSSLLNQYHR